jgi:hypothetical protein
MDDADISPCESRSRSICPPLAVGIHLNASCPPVPLLFASCQADSRVLPPDPHPLRQLHNGFSAPPALPCLAREDHGPIETHLVP